MVTTKPAGCPADDPRRGDGGYPSDIEMDRIATWPHTDLVGLFEYIAERWSYPERWSWGDCGEIECSTGGWSGNEDLISALQQNLVAWAMTWEESKRGGYHRFSIRKADDCVHDGKE